ncbi:MAG: sigma 54-interacting transcriptional regulator [Woeseiaceae bacterium]|nr:sigma 54-interacting transcriptional regulator [Woeseiaceae bacterium]
MSDRDHYRWLFRRAPALATFIGEDGTYLDVSDAFARRLGYARDEILGKSPDTFMTSASAERARTEFRPALRRTGKLERKPISFVSRDGETVECVANAIVELDPDDVFVRTVAMYREISDEARTNFKYRDLYRETPAMLHTLDPDGRLVTVTDRWLSKLGYERDEVIGRPVIEFYSEADRARWADGRLQALINAGDFNNLERQMVTKDGRVLDLLMSAIAHRGEDGDVDQLLIASKDLTERKAAERELRETLKENARLREELERERDYLREEVNVAMNFGRIVGNSPSLKRMLQRVEAVAQTPASVLLLGESGVGKELVARALHARGPRSEGPLVKVNCASIPKELFESEFFGHVKGAFTGAHRDRVGRFQLADGGTLFLDEVGEIPLELQGKLLRVLQESEFERVGDDETRRVDVRVIAATNRDLAQLIDAGEFREDLYYRLSVFPIDVPPLRERGDDVVQLAQDFLKQTCQEFGREGLSLTRAQADQLMQYDWPGNVRELKNVIERAVILSPGNVLRLEASLPTSGRRMLKAVAQADQDTIMTEAELKSLQRRNTIRALEATAWRVSGEGGAAELLGLRPTTLADRIRSMKIEKPRRT